MTKEARRRWRLVNHLYAFTFGYFWLPCPLCGEYFGGHEWEAGAGESIPTSIGRGEGVCYKEACRIEARRRTLEFYARPDVFEGMRRKIHAR